MDRLICLFQDMQTLESEAVTIRMTIVCSTSWYYKKEEVPCRMVAVAVMTAVEEEKKVTIRLQFQPDVLRESNIVTARKRLVDMPLVQSMRQTIMVT